MIEEKSFLSAAAAIILPLALQGDGEEEVCTDCRQIDAVELRSGASAGFRAGRDSALVHQGSKVKDSLSEC